MKEIAVIGGGITGLAAAHRLVELRRQGRGNFRVHVYEAADQAGGSLRTRIEHGCVLEAGPDSLVTEKPWGVDLCRRLGLTDRLVGTNPQFRTSFVLRGGTLFPVPEGFYLMAPVRWGPWMASPLLSWRGKFRALGERWVPRRVEAADESVGGFVRRRFGPELYDRLAEPMLGGIYAADPDALSMRAAFPKFVEMEERYGSLIKAMTGRRKEASQASGESSGARYSLFVTLREGMRALVTALVETVPRGAVNLNTAVTGLERMPDDRWRLGWKNGSRAVEGVVLAVPAYATADLLRKFDPYLAQELEGIPYGSSATVNLIYRRREIPHPLDGFGYVVPSREGRSVLGLTFSSVKFPSRVPEGWATLRAFMGGENLRGMAQRDDKELERAVREELQTTLGIKATPSLTWINRHSKSLPHYRVGHLDRLRRIEEGLGRLRGLALAGNAYRGIGIPDCIHSGETAAETVCKLFRVDS